MTHFAVQRLSDLKLTDAQHEQLSLWLRRPGASYRKHSRVFHNVAAAPWVGILDDRLLIGAPLKEVLAAGASVPTQATEFQG